jgi:hypothetical protein
MYVDIHYVSKKTYNKKYIELFCFYIEPAKRVCPWTILGKFHETTKDQHTLITMETLESSPLVLHLFKSLMYSRNQKRRAALD